MGKENIRVAISIGDYNGIGIEVLLKALRNPKITEMCTPCIYASSKVLNFYKKELDLQELHIHYVRSADQVQPKKVNMITCWEEEVMVEPGVASTEAGKYAFLSLDAAIKDILNGQMDVLLTAPLDKSTVNTPTFPFNGHTEYLAECDKADKHMMLLVSDDFRVGLVTGHIPLKEVANKLSKARVIESIKTMHDTLRSDFGIQTPRIAVLGLNPHAGDNGLLGKEEIEFILPAVKEAVDAGIYAFGPYPSDGFFGTSAYEKFDGILAMYHDQGLIPFKMLGFDNGVNYTAGLSFVRTSPDHGTAYDIAGKGIASEVSFRNALYLAIDLYKKRKLIASYHAQPLTFSPLRKERFRMDF